MSARPPDQDEFDTLSRRDFVRTSVLLGGGSLAVTAGVDAVPRAGQAADRGGEGVSRGPALDVRDFGGIGDGRTADTRAIQQAIDAAHRLGGGLVQLPAGTWRSGTLALRSCVTLELTPGAVLLASPDDDDFASPAGPTSRRWTSPTRSSPGTTSSASPSWVAASST